MKDVLQYKGYIAKIHFSTEDEIFFGKLEGVSDSITFEGESVTDLKGAMTEAVEDYLSLCTELGKVPEKPYKGSFNVRVSPELHRELDKRSTMEGLTLNGLVEKALNRYLVNG